MAYAHSITLTRPLTPQVSLWSVLTKAHAIFRQRHQLRKLDDRLLADIGVTRAEALQEVERAPWDILDISQK
ncbi:MAG: DUF1127 domain-containing protein [Pseudoprimorskyibacter sp.]|nr:DUF1127 domain-containing protein [Pseudoprimorskyibacter sp.]